MTLVKHLRLRLLALFCWSLFLASECQDANGSARVMQKTSFSCAGRPAGYYADVETGCQIYHMCDGLGRQFSYTCPNTTLFQQRMLICDHWYMVNCSKAESNYAANLLIGQRDKPFVNDEENNLRTPRPDLLDRPYAPDYSGESFRSQYKQLTAIQNQIRDESDKTVNKLPLIHHQTSGQTRWRIPPPSRTILPPAYEPQIEYAVSTTTTTTTSTERPRIRHATTSTTRKATFSKAPITQAPKRFVVNEALPLHSRKPTLIVANSAFSSNSLDTEDLGTSHSTRYNTSADFNSAEIAPIKKPLIKLPSKIYEPPFLYPIYNQDDVPPSASKQVQTSTAAPFSRATTRQPPVASSTIRPISRPTTYAGLPFSTSSAAVTPSPSSFKTATASYRSETRTPPPAQSFKPSAAATTAAPKVLNHQQKAQLPYTDLLPPFVDFVQHDIATTQGPPIYYEWKIPSNGLEPPKMDPPIGVDGREYPETSNDYNVNVKGGREAFNTKTNDIASGVASSYFTTSTKTSPQRQSTTRSIKSDAPEAQSVTEKAQRRSDTVATIPLSSDIIQLRKELLIPEYAFPLETIGRTGYAAGDVYNSFQLKIPERRSSSDVKRQWFGENPKCPECHPSFVIPGTCEPCLQR